MSLILSHSGASDYQHCGEKFRLTRIMRVPQNTSWSLVGGSAVHTATERRDRLNFGDSSIGSLDFNDILDEEIEKRLESNPDFPKEEWHRAGRVSKENPNKEDEQFWRKNGPLYVANYNAWRNNSPWQIHVGPDGEPCIEIGFECEIAGIPVRGYIDRVEEHVNTGVLAVDDIKTGANTPKSEAQLVLYAIALEKAGFPKIEYGFYSMLRQGSSTPPKVLSPMRKGVEYTFGQVAKAVEQEVFLPSIGPLCGSCGVKEWCWGVGGEKAAEVLPFVSGNDRNREEVA